MDSANPNAGLQALAKEREARRGVPAATAAPVPSSWAKRPAPSPSANHLARSLLAMHRSIKLARSLGFAACVVGVTMFALCGTRVVWTSGAILCVAFLLARRGAPVVHSLLPEMLYEGSRRPPGDHEITQASEVGLYSWSGWQAPSTSLSAEYTLALDSLAWTCTYGKKNCLTDQMYAGDLRLGKIVGLVWGKLREGVIRC